MKVVIVDYGMGNLASVQKALNFLGTKSVITSDSEEIGSCDRIILPGVGSFSQAMKNLQERGLDKLLTEEVITKGKKFLGICLGMQLIFESGTEPFPCKGLGWIKGTVVRFKPMELRVPHMGWNNITVLHDTYFKELHSSDFYFIHSYHAVPEHRDVIAATVDYGGEIVASVQHKNIFATQFHPEKSQVAGLQVLKNFLKQDA
jgi:glutamine amidotransferase